MVRYILSSITDDLHLTINWIYLHKQLIFIQFACPETLHMKSINKQDQTSQQRDEGVSIIICPKFIDSLLKTDSDANIASRLINDSRVEDEVFLEIRLVCLNTNGWCD